MLSILAIMSAAKNVYFLTKTRTKQNLKPNVMVASNYKAFGASPLDEPHNGLKLIHGPLDQNTLSQRWDRFSTLTYFNDSR